MGVQFPGFRMFLANCTGNEQNTIYRNPVDISSAEDLSTACRKDHVCTEFQDYRRGSANFIRCYAIQGDCDNDNTDDPAAWISPVDVAARLPGIAFYAVKSRNCDKVKHPGEPGEKSARPRWHYYFPLRMPVSDISIASKIMRSILKVFPEYDPDGMKPAQFLFGHSHPVAEYHSGEKDIAQFFINHPEFIVSEPAAVTETSIMPDNIQAQNDFISINAADMLNVIQADDYGTWIKVGMALKSAGIDVSVWDEWSKKSDKYPGYNAIEKKWNSFTAGKITAGTLVYLAEESGWIADPEKQTRTLAPHYKEEHREEYTEKLAAIGIEYSDNLSWKYNWDGSISEVTNTLTGERLYSAPAPDQEQPIPGKSVHTVPAAAKPAAKDSYKPLTVVSAFDLNSNEYKKPDFIVDGILYPGLTIFAGPPKYGKSFLSLDLTCCIASGSAFLDRPTKQGDVLYLDLEGKEWRTSERLNQLGYSLCPDRLDHTYSADTIDKNLLRQLTEWIESKQDPKLIIIDTMARIKGKILRGEDGYAAEYRFLFPLHDLALKKSIAVICVTHTRKGNGLLVDDPMEMIHGSTAQYGTADNGWVLTGRREEATKVLHCSGRDYESVDLELEFSKGRWIPQGTVEDMEKRRAAASYNKDPAVRTIIYLVESNGGRWRGTMQCLFNEIASFTGEYPAADPTRLAHIVRSYMSLLKERNGIMTYIPSSARIIDGKSRKEYEFRQNGFTD